VLGQAAAVQRRLREAAARARAAAVAVRVESGVGRRLLEFSQRAQESLLLSLRGAAPVSGYDRCARAVRAGASGGTLVCGTI
jgi:hypothetical protein